MFILRVDTGPLGLEEASASVPSAFPLAAAPPPAPQLSSRSTFHQPPAFPTTVPRRPVSSKRTRVPATMAALLMVGFSSGVVGLLVAVSSLAAFISVLVDKLPSPRRATQMLPRAGGATIGAVQAPPQLPAVGGPRRRRWSEDERAKNVG